MEESDGVLTPAVIDRFCAKHFGISVLDLRGRSQVRLISDARHCAWILIRNSGKGWFVTELAREYQRDHTSISNGCSVRRCRQLGEDLVAIRNALRASGYALNKSVVRS